MTPIDELKPVELQFETSITYTTNSQGKEYGYIAIHPLKELAVMGGRAVKITMLIEDLGPYLDWLNKKV